MYNKVEDDLISQLFKLYGKPVYKLSEAEINHEVPYCIYHNSSDGHDYSRILGLLYRQLYNKDLICFDIYYSLRKTFGYSRWQTLDFRTYSPTIGDIILPMEVYNELINPYGY